MLLKIVIGSTLAAAFGYAAHLPAVGILVTIATLVAIALPGIILVRKALPDEQSALPVIVFGTVFGTVIMSMM